jgi:hypothetical protein
LRQTVCSTFSRSGWSFVRSASLATGCTSKSKPSLHPHKFPTRSNKVSPRIFFQLQAGNLHCELGRYEDKLLLPEFK